ATSHRRPTTAAGPARGGVSDGARNGVPVQAVPPGGHEALPEGRALPDGQVRRRAPELPARRPRSRARAPVGVPGAAAREAEGPPLLRRAREAVPQLLRKGEPADGRDRREPLASSGVPLRQRARAARLCRLTPPGASDDPARALVHQWPP